jgi:hypothetical protein
MKWFRSNIRHGSRLALLALAIQFVLAFGHHHGAVAVAAPAPMQAHETAVSVLAGKQPAIQVATEATKDSATKTSAAPQTKPPLGHHQSDSDNCAICGLIALAGTVLFTEPPVLLLPEAYHLLYLTTDAEFNHLESRRAVFQSRAPPTS